MPTKRHTFWEISFYVSLLLILIWLILKMTGIINTPPLLEYGFPILSAMYAFFALYRDLRDRIGRLGKGLTTVFMKIEYLERNTNNIKEEVEIIKRGRK